MLEVTKNNNHSRRHTSRKSASSSSSHSTVSISKFEFFPRTLKVKLGTTVRWKKDVEAQQQHVIRFVGEDAGESLTNDKPVFSRSFSVPGIYEYYCENHVYMKGEIVVEGSPGSTNENIVKSKVISSSPPNIDHDAKYFDYLNRRRVPSKEKIRRAKMNRNEAKAKGYPEESSSSSLEIKEPAIEIPAGTDIQLIRFGSFDISDNEEDLELEEKALSPVSELVFSKSPVFGSFNDKTPALDGEDDDITNLNDNNNKPTTQPQKYGFSNNPELYPVALANSVTLPQTAITTQTTTNLPEVATCAASLFDAKSARVFLGDLWMNDVNDESIIWI